MTNLKKSDFEDNSDIVARNLLGRYLSLRQQSGEIIRARLREIAAYEGSGIRTSRKIGYSAGTVSISTKFGRKLFDIATGREGEFSCVTIRAVDLEDIIKLKSIKINLERLSLLIYLESNNFIILSFNNLEILK